MRSKRRGVFNDFLSNRTTNESFIGIKHNECRHIFLQNENDFQISRFVWIHSKYQLSPICCTLVSKQSYITTFWTPIYLDSLQSFYVFAIINNNTEVETSSTTTTTTTPKATTRDWKSFPRFILSFIISNDLQVIK